MSSHYVWRTYPWGASDNRTSRNGALPNSSGIRRIANYYNFVSSHMKKVVFTHCYPVYVVPESVFDLYHDFVFRTGFNTNKLTIVAAQVPRETTDATLPTITLEAITVGGAVSSSESFNRAEDLTSPYTPYNPLDVSWIRQSVEVSPDTVYRGRIRISGNAKLWSLCAFTEGDDVVDSAIRGVCDPSPAEEGAVIRWQEMRQIFEAGSDLWSRNGAHLMQYSPQALNEIDNTAWENVHDGSSVWSATSVGYKFSSQNLGTLSQGVDMELGIVATVVAGETLHVRIVGSTGTLVSRTISGLSSQGVHTFQFTTNPRPSDKYDIQVRKTGGALVQIFAIGLWTYKGIS